MANEVNDSTEKKNENTVSKILSRVNIGHSLMRLDGYFNFMYIFYLK